jgi:hypothetical protein
MHIFREYTLYDESYARKKILFVIKNLVLPRNAGSAMGHACPALRESEFSGSAKRIAARV